MNLLAIDAACSILSIAVSIDNEILYTDTDAGTKHSEIVMDNIDSLMKKASLKPQALDGVLCMGGPGSFTGLRIGYSITKGLAISLSIPFIPIPTLDCIMYQLQIKNEHDEKKHRITYGEQSSINSEKRELILAVIEARKDAFFYAFFRNGERLTPDADGTTGQIAELIKNTDKSKKITVTGPASFLFYNALPPEIRDGITLNDENRGYAKELILIAKDKDLFNNDNSAYLYKGPEYIRKTEAELSQNKFQA